METSYEIGTNKDQLTSSNDIIFGIFENELGLFQLTLKNNDIKTIIYTASHRQYLKDFLCEKVEVVVNDLRKPILPKDNLDPLTKEKYIKYYNQLSTDIIDINEYISRMAVLTLKPPLFYVALNAMMLHYQGSTSASH